MNFIKLSSLAFFLYGALSFANKIPKSILDHSTLAISHNGRWVAFVDPLKRKVPEGCDQALGDNEIDRLDLYDVKRHLTRVLVPPVMECDDPEKVIVGITEVAFSNDDQTVYFETNAWAVAGALHSVRIDGSHLRYITYSNGFAVLPKGEDYGNDLAIGQHRYFIPAGSYNWYWAYTPNGKEIGPIGPDLSGFGLS